ncbi:hypothetical protein GH733_010818 [Mirounga leonina]|nr:hypothetical protein GH733_010818 [Mirounga leonina]
MDLMNGQASSVNIAAPASEKSSSSESLSDKGSELKKSFDAVVFDVLKVTPEEYAGQITLMDVPVFKAIQPDKLYELNNLHALMAVVSGLQSAPIFRLTKTWATEGKKPWVSCRCFQDKKEQGTSDLRRHLSTAVDGAFLRVELYLIDNVSIYIHHQLQDVYLPLLPGEHVLQVFKVHPGIYLSDLTYIDSAYPSTGSILENEQRSNLMNNILRIISDLQQSCDYDIPMLPHVQKYLNSVQYIEELQKFVEDDNYKLSLKIEPGTSTPRSAASREDLVGPEVGASPQSGRKSVAAEGALLPQTPPSPRNLIPHGHRKCHSLGYNFIHKMNTAEFKSATFPNAGPRHLLDDSVMEPHAPSRGQAESSTLSSGISIGSSDGSELSEETSWPAFERNRLYHSLGPVTRVARNGHRSHVKASSSAESEDLAVHLYPGAVTIQGVLRRKTLLKEGKKPTVASWTKYWAALCGTQLFYYAAKSLKATERKHFKSTSNKNVSVVGWMVMMADDPEHPDLFLLTDSEKENQVLETENSETQNSSHVSFCSLIYD